MGQAYQKSEDFSTDPGWDDFGNRTPPQNFGYSATNYTGGAVGEAGGYFTARDEGPLRRQCGSTRSV